MRRFLPIVPAMMILSLLIGPVGSRPARVPPDKFEMTVIEACQSIVGLFRRHADDIWPGYDLSKRPFLVYIPGAWALLFNPPGDIDGFGPCPSEWPKLEALAVYHPGPYRDLVGQLVFDFPVGTAKVAAIGLQPDLFGGAAPEPRTLMGFIVHESFHQFQSEAFGDIPWEREERYPILDVRNSTLAALEMDVLQEAVAAVLQKDEGRAVSLVRDFLAVRGARWNRPDSFVARYEKGQEIREGTASLVEKTSLALAGGAWAEIFRRDFQERMRDGAVAPEDMIRNRIYPVGSALGFLADHFVPGWKSGLPSGLESFSFPDILRGRLGPDGTDAAERLEAAGRRYGLASIQASAGAHIDGYRRSYEKARAAFESQPGLRVEIRLAYRSISRSRNSAGTVWVVDDGAKTLMTTARTFTLKNADLQLQLQNTAVYEENDWEGKRKAVAVFPGAAVRVTVDEAAESLELKPGMEKSFRTIRLEGGAFRLTAALPGRIAVRDKSVLIDLVPAAAK
jgi:hypothetical protein